jgi:WD40 repeat protein
VHAGIYMVDANTGELIWKNNREDDPKWSHGHVGWTANILESSKGIECITNRAGHDDRNLILFSADGQRLMESFPNGHTPVEWDGDPTSELLSNNGKTLSNFNGEIMIPVEGEVPNPIPDSKVIFTADLSGDFRSELVLSSKDIDGRPVILVLSATEPLNQRYIAASENREYRLWLAHNMGGGYGQVTMHELIQLKD